MKSEIRSYLTAAALPFFLSRVFVIALITLAHGISFESVAAREERNLHPHLAFDVGSARNALRCVLSSADAAWYFGIAESGYAPGPFTSTEPKNWVFFPLWPLLLRALNALTGSSVASGFLLSNAFFAAGLVFLQALAARRGLDESGRERMLWFTCFSPVSYFFSAPITESFFFFLLVSTWLAAGTGRAVLAGLLFALLTASRPTGALLFPALVLLFAERGFLRSLRGAAGLAIAPLGMLMYAAYLDTLTGNPLAFRENQPAWGRSSSLSFQAASEILSRPFVVMDAWVFHWLAAGTLGLTAATALFFARKREYSLAYLIALPPWFGLFTGTLLSVPRFALPLFPVYLALAGWTGSPKRERAVLVSFAALLALMAALYGAHVTAAMA